MRLKKPLLFITVIGLCIAGYVSPSYGQGKSNQAPGQNKDKGNANKDVIIGNVESVTDSTIVVEEKKKKTTTETAVDSKTKVIGTSKKDSIKKIKQNDKVAILSTPSGEIATSGGNIKKALKIFVKEGSGSAVPKKRSVHGVITNISGALLTIAHQVHRDRITSVQTTEGTSIKMKGVVDAAFSDLQIGQRIVAMGDFQTDATFLARRIHVIPGLATGIFKKQPVATASASLTPSATGSATPSATPTATSAPTPTATATPSATPTP